MGGEKICAIGIKVVDWITMHGFALNVTTRLEGFERIIPCGIFHKGVTSMQQILGQAPSTSALETDVANTFGDVFARVPQSVALESLTNE